MCEREKRLRKRKHTREQAWSSSEMCSVPLVSEAAFGQGYPLRPLRGTGTSCLERGRPRCELAQLFRSWNCEFWHFHTRPFTFIQEFIFYVVRSHHFSSVKQVLFSLLFVQIVCLAVNLLFSLSLWQHKWKSIK